MSTVILESVSRHFGAFAAVQGVSLTVEPGEFVTLLGPSGCGKTTTLRMIAGLEHNTGGRIRIGDRAVSDPQRGLFVPPERRNLGMVFQSYAIWPHMTVFDNVAYPLKIRRLPSHEVAERVTAVLRLVEMERFADRPAPALSGGQQQRVAIARALVAEPAVLLLDEPLSNLDAKLRHQMGDEFRGLQRRLGITTLYVTHDQDEAMALSDRVVVMQSGRVLQIDTPETIYRRPATQAVAIFLGAPNVLHATAGTSARMPDGEIDVQINGTGWQGRCRAASAPVPGEPVAVMIRPENLRVAEGPTPESADLVVKGTVEDVQFRGARRTVALRVGGTRLTLDAPSSTAPRTGDQITVYVPEGEAWAVERSQEQRAAGAA